MREEILKQIVALDTTNITKFGEQLNEIFKNGNIKVIDRGDLTKREKEIMLFVAQGLSNKDIAKKIFTSSRTVEIHRAKIAKKLHLKSQKQQLIELVQKETPQN